MTALSLQVICGSALVILFLYFVFVKKFKVQTKQMATVAFLIVMTVILDRLSLMIPVFGFPAFRLSISQLPLMLIGALFGPGIAFFSGVIYDAIGIFTNPTAFPFLGFTLNKAFIGMIPAVVFLWGRKNTSTTLKKVFILLLTLFMTVTTIFLLLNDGYKNGGEFIEMNRQLKLLMTALTWGIYASTLVSYFYFLRKTKNESSRSFFLCWSISIILVELCIQLFLTPIWLQAMYGIPFGASVLLRQIKAIFILPLNMWLGIASYQILQRLPSFQSMKNQK